MSRKVDLSRLTPEQRALLEEKLRERRRSRSASGGQASAIERRDPREDPVPASFEQRRLWIYQQIHPRSSAYHIVTAMRAEGVLDAAALSWALNEIVRRHESLRTTFRVVDGQPFQVIASPAPLPLPRVDLLGLEPERRNEEARQLVVREAARPFDLARGPILRARLLVLGQREHIFLKTLHHIAGDGWSISVLNQELSTLYEAALQGTPSPLAELPIQYADFTLWQSRRLEGESYERRLNAWGQRLGGGLPKLSLPVDRPRPKNPTWGGDKLGFRLSRVVSERVQELSARQGMTPFMTLLSALSALLHRYTGQRFIPIGSPVANRERAEVEPLIGFFVNILLLRVDLGEEPPSFRELMKRSRQASLEALEHQDIPFQHLAERLRGGEDLAGAPPLRVAFSLQVGRGGHLRLSGLRLSDAAIGGGSAQTDLTLFLWEGEGGLEGELEYSTDVFVKATAERFLRHFKTLLAAAVEEPDRRLSELPPRAGEALQLVGEGASGDSRDLYEQTNLARHQLLLWIQQKLDPNLVPNNMASLFFIQGRLDEGVFAAAFGALLEGNDALRAVIEDDDGVPRWRSVEGRADVHEVVDLSGEREPEAAARRLALERCRRPFDLSRGMIDSALLVLGPDRTAWYVNHHQLIADAWSTGLIFERLSSLYGRALACDPVGKVEVFPAYQSFLDFERAQRGRRRFRRQEQFWKEKLSVPSEPARYYGVSPTGPSRESQRVEGPMGVDRARRLEDYLQSREGVVVPPNLGRFSALAAGLIIYLHCIGDSRRIALGVPSHNRSKRQFLETVGCFMVVLPIQILVEDGETFDSLVTKVYAEFVEALKNGQYAVENPAHGKAYDVMLNYLTVRMRRDFAGLPFQMEWVHPGHGSDCSLAVQVHDFLGTGDPLVSFDLACEAFDVGSRESALAHFFEILDTCLEHPGRGLDRAELLASDHQKKLVADLEQEASFDFDI